MDNWLVSFREPRLSSTISTIPRVPWPWIPPGPRRRRAGPKPSLWPGGRLRSRERKERTWLPDFSSVFGVPNQFLSVVSFSTRSSASVVVNDGTQKPTCLTQSGRSIFKALQGRYCNFVLSGVTLISRAPAVNLDFNGDVTFAQSFARSVRVTDSVLYHTKPMGWVAGLKPSAPSACRCRFIKPLH